MARERDEIITRGIEVAATFIDQMCQPSMMSPEQALQFLNGVADHISGSIEALREENPELE